MTTERLPSIESDETGLWLRVPVCMEGESSTEAQGGCLFLGDDPKALDMRMNYLPRCDHDTTGHTNADWLQGVMALLKGALRDSRSLHRIESEHRRRESHG